jgi:alpha/beta superfamily hydrolase
MISDCVKRIKETIKDDKQPILIGSSLGGLLAAKTAMEVQIEQLILLNPAIIPQSVDISKIQGMPHRILQEMQDEQLFREKIPCKILIIAGTMDDTVPNDWVVEFAKKQEATLMFLHDDHSLTYNLEKLLDIIGNLLDEKH